MLTKEDSKLDIQKLIQIYLLTPTNISLNQIYFFESTMKYKLPTTQRTGRIVRILKYTTVSM